MAGVPSPPPPMIADGRSHHQSLRRSGAQERDLTSQTEEEEGGEASQDLRQAMGFEMGVSTYSQANDLVRAANPSPDSGEQAKGKCAV